MVSGTSNKTTFHPDCSSLLPSSEKKLVLRYLRGSALLRQYIDAFEIPLILICGCPRFKTVQVSPQARIRAWEGMIRPMGLDSSGRTNKFSRPSLNNNTRTNTMISKKVNKATPEG